jgi:heptosyltransferase-2
VRRVPRVKNVLLIRLSSLGDVVLTTPVAANLKRAGARVAVLTRRAFAPVFEGNPTVDEVLIFEDRGFWGWARAIRARRYDAVLDLHGTARSRLWSFVSGAPRRARYDKRAGARRRLVWMKKTVPALAGGVVDRYLETLTALGVPAGERSPRLYLSRDERLSPALAEAVGESPFLVLAPGAQHATKRWPADRFAALADRWSAEHPGARVVLIGARTDAAAGAAVRAVARGPVVDLIGRTSLRDMARVLERAALVVTNDSGAMHVAAALGRPVVAVFGPTVREFGFFPIGERAVVVEGGPLPCRPCALHGRARCPEGHFRCMTDVSVECVWEAARAATGGARP